MNGNLTGGDAPSIVRARGRARGYWFLVCAQLLTAVNLILGQTHAFELSHVLSWSTVALSACFLGTMFMSRKEPPLDARARRFFDLLFVCVVLPILVLCIGFEFFGNMFHVRLS